MKDKLITFKGKWKDPKNDLWTNVEPSWPIKKFIHMEKFIRGNDITKVIYWVGVWWDEKRVRYIVDEETYKHIQVVLKKNGRNIVVDEVIEKEKEKLVETIMKKSVTAIGSLEVLEEV